MDAEFARAGTCVPQAQHEVLLATPSLEVWDGAKKLGPAISRIGAPTKKYLRNSSLTPV